MAEALDRDGRRKRCGFCNDPGHNQNNKTACWKNRKLVSEDGEARVQAELLDAMKGHLFAVPAEVRVATRLLRNGEHPRTAELLDYVLYHQKKANEEMKATMQLVARVAEKMRSLDSKIAHPPEEMEDVQERGRWERAITTRGNEIGEVKRMTQDLIEYLTVVGEALDRGFTGDPEVFAAIEKFKDRGMTGTDRASASVNADGEFEVVKNPDEERFEEFMWVFGPPILREKLCEHCHTREAGDPWPFFYPRCAICGDQPSRHHGRCCPKRHATRKVEQETSFGPRTRDNPWMEVERELARRRPEPPLKNETHRRSQRTRSPDDERAPWTRASSSPGDGCSRVGGSWSRVVGEYNG